MMMAQTLQAVQAQTQALTQLATVISQQGTQSETKADSAGKLDFNWLPAMPLPARAVQN